MCSTSVPSSSRPSHYPSSSSPTFTPSSSIPTSTPSCGMGSYGDPINCNKCSPGSYTDLFGSVQCLPCNAGTYSDKYGSKSCTYCDWPFSSVPGSSECLGVWLNPSAYQYILFSVIFVIVFLGSICFIHKKNWIFSFVLICLPVCDYVSDVFYLLDTNFYRPYLFWASAATLMLPAISFILYLRSNNVQPRIWFPFFSRLVWLGSHEGLPTVYGILSSCGIDYISLSSVDMMSLNALFKQISNFFTYIFLWLAYIFLQIICLILLTFLLVLSFFFSVFWYLFGMFLFQMKSFASGRVWNIWLSVWSDDITLRSYNDLDIAFLHDALYSEFFFEALPQLLLIAYNIYLIKTISMISAITFFISSLVVVYGLYRIVYLHYFKGVAFYVVPMVPKRIGEFLYVSDTENENFESEIGNENSSMVNDEEILEENLTRKAFSEEALNNIIIESDPSNLWEIIVKSRAIYENESKFRILNSLNMTLRTFKIKKYKDFNNLSIAELTVIRSRVPEILHELFNKFVLQDTGQSLNENNIIEGGVQLVNVKN